MPTMYCKLCERPVEARRHIGAGTVILAVISAGLSLIAIPFYNRRCSICGSTAVSATPGTAVVSPRQVDELEARVRFAESELEASTAELERVRTERDFYRQLLGDPARKPASGQ